MGLFSTVPPHNQCLARCGYTQDPGLAGELKEAVDRGGVGVPPTEQAFSLPHYPRSLSELLP